MVTLIRTILSGNAAVGGGVQTFAFSDPVDDLAAAALVNAVDTFWSAVAANLTFDITLSVEANPSRYAASNGVLQEVFTAAAPGPVTGSVSTDPVARSTQYLIRWATADIVDGRVIKGRTYVPACPASQIRDDGTVEPALIAIIDALGEDLITDSGGLLSVWHRPIAGAGGSEHLVTGVSGWNEWAVLRGRRD